MSLWAWPNFHNVSQDLLPAIFSSESGQAWPGGQQCESWQAAFLGFDIAKTECIQVVGPRTQSWILPNKYVLKYAGKAFTQQGISTSCFSSKMSQTSSASVKIKHSPQTKA